MDGQVILISKPWTSARVEEEVAQIEYHGEGLGNKRDPAEKTRLPRFNELFYSMVYNLGRIPHDEEFVDAYIAEHFVPVDGDAEKLLLKGTQKVILSRRAIRARTLRAYPSLIRDFHLLLLCHESGLFDAVSYSMSDDFYDGTDLIITYKGETYAIDLFTNTQRAKSFKEAKDRHRHPDRHDWPHIAIMQDQPNKVERRISLYDEASVWQIVEAIQQAR